MGIKYFWSWFRKNFINEIYNLTPKQTIYQYNKNITIDTLLIDANGIFHNSAQKVFEYGEYKRQPSLLNKIPIPIIEDTFDNRVLVFRDICSIIDKLIEIVNPKKTIVICIDGPAPLAKQCQQRQRRYISGMNRASNNRMFDSNSITPGTEFMDQLSDHIKHHINSILNKRKWNKIVFSSEKVPGEGEHGCMEYVRKHGKDDETFCIHGLDADLIMLALATHKKNFFILRENTFDREFAFYLIDLFYVREKLIKMLQWDNASLARNIQNTIIFFTYDAEQAINDFIAMCFTVGNDFLPHMPAIDIARGSIEILISCYKQIGSHITKKSKQYGCKIRKKTFGLFLACVGQYEETILNEKIQNIDEYIFDPLLDSFTENKKLTSIIEYKNAYYKKKKLDIKQTCLDYFRGVQWVISYYTVGVPDWTFKYPHHYAPFASSLAENIQYYRSSSFTKNSPSLPFVQLLSVLPPSSSHLLPAPLNKLLSSVELEKYCPKEFIIDTEGKRNVWEGIALLPIIDFNLVKSLYTKNETKIESKAKARNRIDTVKVFKAQ
jgi:5'-3' exonuclease